MLVSLLVNLTDGERFDFNPDFCKIRVTGALKISLKLEFLNGFYGKKEHMVRHCRPQGPARSSQRGRSLIPLFVCLFVCLFVYFFFLFLETSDHSDIENRVRILKDQLGHRKREAKRLYHERKRQRKAMLRAQEASLRKELQVREMRQGKAPS